MSRSVLAKKTGQVGFVHSMRLVSGYRKSADAVPNLWLRTSFLYGHMPGPLRGGDADEHEDRGQDRLRP